MMALTERGLHTRGLRIRLILQSEDVDTHSFMSDNSLIFNDIVERLQQAAIADIRASIPEGERIRKP
jgi:hypothetical protein